MDKRSEHDANTNVPVQAVVVIPAGFRPLPNIEVVPAASLLGYPRNERFVIVAYHPEAEAIIWKDGRHSGFGEGGWDYYFRILLPAATALQADLTDQDHIGQDVLVLDREGGNIYLAPRPCADEFLAIVIGLEPPHRRCMCARPLEGRADCSTCPALHSRADDNPLNQAENSK